MAQSYIEYTSGLTGTTFSVPFKYISIDDIHALGFADGAWEELTIAEDGRDDAAKTVTLSAAPSAYQKVRIYRQSSTTALVDFQNGSRLSERDLDTAYQQGLFVAQEVSEDANTNQYAAAQEASLLSGTTLTNFASSVHTGDGSTNTFNLSFPAQTDVAEAYVVSIDGTLQSPVDAYTVSISPSQITFASAPPNSAKIVVVTAASAASATSVDDVTVGLTSLNKIEVKDGAVTSAKIATDAVTEAKIADDAVTSAKIAADAVGSTEIAASAVGQAELASDAVTNGKIADDAVTEAKIADGAVTPAKLSTGGPSWSASGPLALTNTGTALSINNGSEDMGFVGNDGGEMFINAGGTQDVLSLRTGGVEAAKIDSDGNIIIPNVPTSPSGLPSGAIYSDAGVLKIVS